MLIEKVWAENFRNFKKFGTRDNPIRFNTEGKVNLIYGKSGFGKSTILQLLQWILYGECDFGEKETDLLNSGERERLPVGNKIDLRGNLLILDGTERFRIERRWTFQKISSGRFSRQEGTEYFNIERQSADGSYKPFGGNDDERRKFIDKLMPQGLAGYFFFDGEQFIARFGDSRNTNGKTLKEAIGTLFQTDVYDIAKELLSGSTWSVSGTLDRSLRNAPDAEGKGLEGALAEEKGAREDYESTKRILDLRRAQATSQQKEMGELREALRNKPNQQDLNRQIDDLERQLISLRKQYGELLDKIAESARWHFITFAVAKDVVEAPRLKPDEIGDQEVPAELTRKLIESLRKRGECICGNPVGPREEREFERWLAALPPASYRPTYESYLDQQRVAANLEVQRGFSDLHALVRELLNNEARIEEAERLLEDCRKRQSGTFDAETKRKWERLEKLEGTIKSTSESIRQLSAETERKRGAMETAKNRLYEAQRRADVAVKERYALSLAKQVAELLGELAEARTRDVRMDLQEAIEEYLNKILVGATKTVELDEEFRLTVREGSITYKSRGQAAVACYSYVLGILAVLKRFRDRREEDILDLSDEYPLVIDAPFSETDREQTLHALSYFREIPKQIVLMSNRDLNDMVPSGDVGTLYVIKGKGVDAIIEECPYEEVGLYFAEGGEKED